MAGSNLVNSNFSSAALLFVSGKWRELYRVFLLAISISVPVNKLTIPIEHYNNDLDHFLKGNDCSNVFNYVI